MNITQFRNETPGTGHVLHFNNAGSSLPPQPVVEVQQEYLQREAEIGGYEVADEHAETLEGVYDSISEMLGAQSTEIALTDNATRAWDMAFYSLARDFKAGNRILTSRASYASNYLAFLQIKERTGISIDVIEPDESGQVDVRGLRNSIDDSVKLIALTHIPTNNGLVNPAEEVGAIAKDTGIPYLLDACQSAGQMPLRVEELGCTMLSATGRKFLRGPRGTGFLYVSKDWITRLEPPLVDLHAATWTSDNSYELQDDARRFECWEANMGARLGLGKAVAYAMDVGLEHIWERNQELASHFRTQLEATDSIEVFDRGARKCGIVTFASSAVAAEDVQTALRQQDINVSVSTPSSTLLDAEARQLPDLVRASVHYYNTCDEIDRFLSALRHIVTT